MGKYYSAGLFSESVYSCWKTFLNVFPEKYGQIPHVKPQWPVGTVLKGKNCAEAVPEVILPPKIVQLHDTEVNPIEPVS